MIVRLGIRIRWNIKNVEQAIEMKKRIWFFCYAAIHSCDTTFFEFLSRYVIIYFFFLSLPLYLGISFISSVYLSHYHSIYISSYLSLSFSLSLSMYLSIFLYLFLYLSQPFSFLPFPFIFRFTLPSPSSTSPSLISILYYVLTGPSRTNRRIDGQLGGIVVEKCKFLQESGCKGLCLHQCKLPVRFILYFCRICR